ncbi:MAG TPA: NrfD/PsrC family molybdoenzyme membrane anchor subunit [Pseudolabrys sp.]|nr:NrfD/PsrC family molybdoenzyme membrane anchor subunit [Pseudolabrys sp.]
MSLQAEPPEIERWTEPPGRSYLAISELVAAPLLERRQWRWRAWWIAFGIASGLTLIMAICMSWLFATGVGIFGNNTTIVWGLPIADYVWWIGIGNAGTLISSMLLLMRQRWRASINRFAEAMTLFAATIAGLFPIMHLGRPEYFYWLLPYPNTMVVWPQWRSALIWDFWAISSYILFSILFWYVGLIPDLATLRDRAKTAFPRSFYGALALGWRGSARHWYFYEHYHLTMACLAVPLVVSLHSVVGMDFAASLMPGWQESIFPPYFVVGAMYSGFAMVVLLTALVRWGFNLQPLITAEHFNVMAKIMLAASIIMGLSYLTEWFAAWYHGERAERWLVGFEFTGGYAPVYWCMLLFNCIVPQLFWFVRIRCSIVAVVVIAILINVGMWLERIEIVWNTLSHDFLPSMWRIFIPTFWDWALLFSSLGFFGFLYLLLARIFPMVSMHETRRLIYEESHQ